VLARQQLQRWAWERVGRGKLLLRYRLLGGARRFGAHGGERGGTYRGCRPPACSSFGACCLCSEQFYILRNLVSFVLVYCFPFVFSPFLLSAALCSVIRGLMRGMATLPQGIQELLVVKDKVGRPPGELGVSKSMECDIFPSVL